MKKIIGILTIAVMLVVLGFVCFIVGYLILMKVGVIDPPFGKSSYIDNMDDPEFRSRVAHQSGFVFPDTIQWQKSYYFCWQDIVFYAKFRILEDDIEQLLSQQPNGQWYENDKSKLPSKVSDPLRDWMNLEHLSHFKVYERTEPGYHFCLVVDMDSLGEDGFVTVYLEFYDF